MDDTAPPDVEPPLDNLPTPPTMVYYLITWLDIHVYESLSVVAKPNIGVVFSDDTITDK